MQPGQPDGPRRRRPRYAGTHPRRYEQRYKELDPDRYPAMGAHIRAQGRTPAGTHVPVLLAEVLQSLDPRPGRTVCDCTLGHGGHALECLLRIGPAGRLIGFDMDGRHIERTERRIREACRETGWEPDCRLYRRNYAGIRQIQAQEAPEGFDAILADLGVSSMQVDDPARGMSYKYPDSPLDMRMDDRLQRTAADLLGTISEAELSEALWTLADEPDHERIAREVVRQRAERPIRRVGDLLEVIARAKGTGADRRGDDAALTFQALRIMVNDELGALKALLREAPACLGPGGRIGIISFHSGEDRLVKHALRDGLAAGLYAAVSPEAIRPTPREIHDNPRSRSARLRWAQRAGR